MIDTKTIEQVIESQRRRLVGKDLGQPRHLGNEKSKWNTLQSHALIVTGIRRCGKSTLLQQIHEESKDTAVYVNFEDPRLAGFSLEDFNRLHQIAEERKVEIYFFDEIQNVPQWESFVRFRLDEGYSIFISGSNAEMLSKELGTKLTGRHITKELFPFSYLEYLEFIKQDSSAENTYQYLKGGGFPEFLKTKLPEVLVQVFNDILIRDIAVRYHLKQHLVLQQLAVWLVSNVGKPVTGNSLRKIFEISSSSTMSEYLKYLSDAYLFFFLPKYSYSPKVQMVNAKKVYCIDNGFIEVNSLSASADEGRLLENLVFMEIRRKWTEVFYFSEKRECDFVIFEKKKAKYVIQVCWQLNENNLSREIQGLKEAMQFFGLDYGQIITFNQSDMFEENGLKMELIPFHVWVN
ncbi:MAG: ATP-binding protein [Bacteroidia bacterium]|nr:ATP-binding protein [Bacteroidia bacterium]